MTGHGRRRVVVEGVSPEIDAGRFPAKRVQGELVAVEADVFADGHDAVSCVLRWRRHGDGGWHEQPMSPLVNDRFAASFVAEELGRYEYTVAGWVDHFATWQRDLRKKVEAGQSVSVDLLVGAELVAAAARRARPDLKRVLTAWVERLEDPDPDVEAGLSPDLAQAMDACADRSEETVYERVLEVAVGPPEARCSTWYEFFPRSCAQDAGRHGTFADAEKRLPYVARMGFDVVYLPPIHPIGTTNRKGTNYSTESSPDDIGSPWAIGSEDGGHTAIHPELGTFEDFDRFVAAARRLGMEVALDLAFQCSPDHPWVKEHPEWFRHRPDGTIQFAENPPKRYEDIYPLEFDSESWPELWDALLGVVRFWIDRGVHIFRVDNPHTKPFPFWQWLIGEIKKDRPDVVFLSEAFTRPKVMNRLAKIGFDQSYTYFTWRTTKWELTEYLTELTQPPLADYFRPNLWPNTPDILPEHLQYGGRPAFMARLVLAATLGANYGIYGPAFELGEHRPLEQGREVYLDSEKFQLRAWNLDDPDSLADFIARVNETRRRNPALQIDRTLRFHEVQNDQLIAYSKTSQDGSNIVLTVVNLDPHHTHAGMLRVPIETLGIDDREPYEVHDFLTDARYTWMGEWNYVELDPHSVPAHVLGLRHPIRREQDFDYF